MKATIDVNEANFESEVLKSEQPALVGFATGWALPSMTAEEALEEIATESASLKVARVELDHNPNFGAVVRYSVYSNNPVLCWRQRTDRNFWHGNQRSNSLST